MRKIAAILLAFVLILSLVGCGEKDLSEAGLRAMLEAKVTQPILAFEYDDYDGDGVFEAFAFVGEEQQPDVDESYMGEIWFVSARGAEKIEACANGYWGLINVYAFGKNKFAVLNHYATTGGLVNIWGVKNGKPHREKISGIGGGFTQLDGNSFTLYHSTYDFDETGGVSTGHTWKNYWFFWDGRAFHEYGGVNITEAQLRKCDGAAEVLDAIVEKGETIGGIFYRGNGIINVNHSKRHESGRSNYFTTLLLHGTSVTVVETEDPGGFYLPALAPGIAVYPKLPQIFN